MTVIVGLDLAGSPERNTGACRLAGPRRLRCQILHRDSEIDAFVRKAEPDLVVVDAPLSLPSGRRTIEDRSGPHLRACDRELLRRHIRFFPVTLGPMRMLTARGLALLERLESEGHAVVEGYPGAAQDILGLPRKSAGTPLLQRQLRRAGLGGDLDRRSLSHDELDAITIAWVGWRYRKGDGELIGDPSEGLMLLPSKPPAGRRP